MRRLGSFLREWFLLFAWGDDWGDKAARWIPAVLLLAGTTLGQEQGWFYLELAPGVSVRANPSTGSLVTAAVVVVWALVTAGAAWPKSRGVDLWVAEALEEDPEHRVFRLRIGIRGKGVAHPAAYVERVIDVAGLDAIPASQFPVELLWTHQEPDRRPAVSENTPLTVGVVFGDEGAVGYSGSVRVAELSLRVHGMGFFPEVSTQHQFQEPRKIAVKVSVVNPDTSEKVIRWFGFFPEPGSPLFHKAWALKAGASDNPIWP